ncbi:MAG: hypothetical protein ACXQT4_02020 [Methanotrichaceae archaeon]
MCKWVSVSRYALPPALKSGVSELVISMNWKFVFLVLLASVGLVNAGSCNLTVLPAVEDVYIDFGNEEVYDTGLLRCEMGQINETWPVTPLIKFNVSGINVSENDIGILVLKADFVKKDVDNEPGVIVLFPTGSNWTEESNFSDLGLALAPTLDIIDNGENLNYDKIGVRLDNGDRIFAFEVSKYLKDATEDELSFILVAVDNDLNYLVWFKSGETEEGPHILIMPYPSEEVEVLRQPQEEVSGKTGPTSSRLIIRGSQNSPALHGRRQSPSYQAQSFCARCSQ